jgi:membrane protease YdiL (CAAX protease family)
MLLTVITTLGALPLISWLTAAPQTAFIAGNAVSLVAITLATFAARRWIDHRSIASLGLAWGRQAARDLLVGIALSGLTIGLIFALEFALGWLRVESWSLATLGLPAVLRELALLFLTFVAVGWAEELMSRGYWLQNLEDGLRLPGAVLISSLAFAILHLANPNISVLALLGLFVAGLFFAYAYLATRQLWLPIGLHIGWNFFEGPVLGFPVSGINLFTPLLGLTRSGPAWLTGGAFGPEAGLLQYPALLLSVWLIYRYSRGRANPHP